MAWAYTLGIQLAPPAPPLVVRDGEDGSGAGSDGEDGSGAGSGGEDGGGAGGDGRPATGPGSRDAHIRADPMNQGDLSNYELLPLQPSPEGDGVLLPRDGASVPAPVRRSLEAAFEDHGSFTVDVDNYTREGEVESMVAKHDESGKHFEWRLNDMAATTCSPT